MFSKLPLIDNNLMLVRRLEEFVKRPVCTVFGLCVFIQLNRGSIEESTATICSGLNNGVVSTFLN